jgi:hypothetical protein
MGVWLMGRHRVARPARVAYTCVQVRLSVNGERRPTHEKPRELPGRGSDSITGM